MFRKLISFYKKLFWSCEKYAKSQGVRIGNKCWIGTKSFGSEPYLISIGDHVQITNGVRFFTHGGGWLLREDVPDFDCFGKINIGNNVYIGSCSLILPGITIGNNVLIGAGSVVTKSVPDNSIIAGNPAKVLNSFSEYKSKIENFNMKTKNLAPQDKRRYLETVSEDKFIKK